MLVNGVSIVNLKTNDDGHYECDIILDKEFLGHFKQNKGYSDYYSFDKKLLENSMNAFKKSKFYKLSYFTTEDDIRDFYTVDMFINDLCDLYLDEQIALKLNKRDSNIKYIVIGESYIDNRVVYASANSDIDIKNIKQTILNYLNNSANIRIYENDYDFTIETRSS